MSSVDDCMKAWGEERPPTPEHLKKWRRPVEPGQRVLPPGQRDAKVDLDARYGVKGGGNRDSGIFQGRRAPSPLRDFYDEQQEAVYSRNRRAEAPPVPEGTTFGRITEKSEEAGAVIWSARATAESEAAEALRPHRRPRGCDLAAAGIDPAEHRFGARPGARDVSAAGKSDSSEIRSALDQTSVLEREERAEAERRRRRDARRPHVPDIRFGKPQGEPGGDEWDAGHCIAGEYGEEAQRPDADLGKSTRRLHPGANLPVGAEDRRFGAASIRSDLSAPRVRSVADNTNYGDEAGGKALLYPHPEAFGGVSNEDFEAERDEAEAREILGDAGMATDDETWQQVAREARARAGGRVTIESLRDAFNRVVLQL